MAQSKTQLVQLIDQLMVELGPLTPCPYKHSHLMKCSKAFLQSTYDMFLAKKKRIDENTRTEHEALSDQYAILRVERQEKIDRLKAQQALELEQLKAKHLADLECLTKQYDTDMKRIEWKLIDLSDDDD